MQTEDLEQKKSSTSTHELRKRPSPSSSFSPSTPSSRTRKTQIHSSVPSPSVPWAASVPKRSSNYLSDPLEKSLRDENPYVRKTAAICVAKLYDLKPELAIDRGFVGMLKDMVGDSNPMVVANAVTALTDIHQMPRSKNDPSASPPSSSSTRRSSPSFLSRSTSVPSGVVSPSSTPSRAIVPATRSKPNTSANVSCLIPARQRSVVLGAVKVVLIHHGQGAQQR